MRLPDEKGRALKYYRAAEMLEKDPTEQEIVFDPERDVPQGLREEWREGSTDYQELARVFSASFLLSFPERRQELQLGELWAKIDRNVPTFNYLELIVLFPDKLTELKQALVEKLGSDLTRHVGAYSPNEMVRFWTAIQVLFPERVTEYSSQMEKAWSRLRGWRVLPDAERARHCADARLMFPHRFSEVGIDSGILKNFAGHVRREIGAWPGQFLAGTAQDIAALSVLTAKEVRLTPMGGIEIVRGKAVDIRRPGKLPERLQT